MEFNELNAIGMIVSSLVLVSIFVDNRRNKRLFGVFFCFLIGMALFFLESPSCNYAVKISQESLANIGDFTLKNLPPSPATIRSELLWGLGLPAIFRDYCHNVDRWSICMFILSSICWLLYFLQGKLELLYTKFNMPFDESETKTKEYLNFTVGEWILLVLVTLLVAFSVFANFKMPVMFE